MTRSDVLQRVGDVIRDVFNDEELVITEDTVASDVPGWDSIMHITLLSVIEDEFDIQFAMKDVVNMKNVGHMVELIMEQLD